MKKQKKNPNQRRKNKGRYLPVVMAILIALIIGNLGMVTGQKIIEYTPDTKKVCENGECNLVLNSGIKYVYEDNQWKDIKEARSLKGSGITCEVDFDGENNVECLDWNWTSRKLKIWKEKEFKDTPIKVYKEDLLKGYELKSFKDNNDKKEIIVQADYEDVIHFGEESTEVKLQSNETVLLSSCYLVETSPSSVYCTDNTNYVLERVTDDYNFHSAYKFNITALEGGLNITKASLNLYIITNSLDVDTEGFNISVHRANDQAWSIASWNNPPSNINSTFTDTKYFFGGVGEPASEFYSWDIYGGFIEDYNAGNLNYTSYLQGHDAFGVASTADYVGLATKYHSNSLYHPYLNITYTEGGEPPDTTPPTFDSHSNYSQQANQSFSQSVTATDNVAIDTYTLNDTSIFVVNGATGTITNSTTLNYTFTQWLNYSVNDTSNNLASQIFSITITEQSFATGTTTVSASTCRYKKFGIYNDNLPFYKEADCV